MPNDPFDLVYTLLGTLGVLLLIELLRCIRSIDRRTSRLEVKADINPRKSTKEH